MPTALRGHGWPSSHAHAKPWAWHPSTQADPHEHAAAHRPILRREIAMFLGIEIGGTKLQLGLGAGDGVMPRLWRGPVDAAGGGPGIRRQIAAAVPELLASSGVAPAQVRGVGVGFGGPVDDDTQSTI